VLVRGDERERAEQRAGGQQRLEQPAQNSERTYEPARARSLHGA
jgi:hypothetical protein